MKDMKAKKTFGMSFEYCTLGRRRGITRPTGSKRQTQPLLGPRKA